MAVKSYKYIVALQKYPPGAFVIIQHNRYSYIEKEYGETVTLLNIIEINKQIDASDFRNPIIEYYIKVKIIDWISEIEQDFETTTNFKFEDTEDRIKLLFKSTSKKECEEKFKELKKEYNIKWSMKKFNV